MGGNFFSLTQGPTKIPLAAEKLLMSQLQIDDLLRVIGTGGSMLYDVVLLRIHYGYQSLEL